MDFWKVGIAQSVDYEMKMKLYVEYQEDILLHLSKPLLGQSSTLLKEFWPSSNWVVTKREGDETQQRI